jgi:competence protein ComEA
MPAGAAPGRRGSDDVVVPSVPGRGRGHPEEAQARLGTLLGRATTLGDVLPPAVRGARLRLDRPAVGALAIVAASAVVLAGWFAWQARADLAPAPPAVRATGADVGSTTTPTSPAQPTAPLVVDVAGRVRRPGLVRLPPGSRVADALVAAGGALPGVDLSTVNLARPVADGEQVLVGFAATGAGPPSTGAGSGTAGQPVDLNSATVEQLDALPGVGPVLAQRIVDWRTSHGRFTSVDQLGQVGGIGTKKLNDIRPHVRV